VLSLELPGHQPLLMVRYLAGEMVPTAMDLDTVHLDPEQASLVLVWRCVLPLKPGIRVLEALLLDREGLAQARALREWLRGRTGAGDGGAPGPIPSGGQA
jgi:hypothetical protein